MSGDLAGARRLRHRAVGGRRPRVVLDGARPRGRGRPQRRPRRHHLLLADRLRRRRRLRRGHATRRWRSPPGSAEVAVAWRARKRASKASRPWAQRVAAHRRRGQRPVEPAVGPAAPGRRDRHADAPLHARVRRHARSPRQRRARVPQAREPQPGRDDVREDADARGVHGRALDLRAAVPVRQLPRDRRRARGGDRVGRAGQGPAAAARRTSTPARRASRPSTRR